MSKQRSVLSGTGGAIPVKNEKGEISMQKVKVHRYVAGQKPKYAADLDEDDEVQNRNIAEQHDDEEEENSNDEPLTKRPQTSVTDLKPVEDRRLKRLMESDKERPHRHQRYVSEPEILMESKEVDEEMKQDEIQEEQPRQSKADSDEEMEEDERMRRRIELKKRALQRQEELMKIEEDQHESDKSDEEEDEDDESEYEECTDSESESMPRLKPVFVRKQDRETVKEKEAQLQREKEIQAERDRLHEETVKHTRKIIQNEVNNEKLAEKETDDDNIKCDFLTDDENDENAYEMWKLRELKRMKRDREEREQAEKERKEIERLRSMSEEERLAYLKANPKQITNAQEKGKYKYLQKYYHRGAFFMDKEEDVYKRNYAEPTLDDHFDKTVLPKVMQVKNFGFAGRTKYTHLLDQDTTRKEDNPWQNHEKVLGEKGGGLKPISKPKK